jgi:hypothetical protein
MSTSDIHDISTKFIQNISYDIQRHPNEYPCRYPSDILRDIQFISMNDIHVISRDICLSPNEISTQDILWISKVFYPSNIQRYPHHLSITDTKDIPIYP